MQYSRSNIIKVRKDVARIIEVVKKCRTYNIAPKHDRQEDDLREHFLVGTHVEHVHLPH